jgi:hypothetical protein
MFFYQVINSEREIEYVGPFLMSRTDMLKRIQKSLSTDNRYHVSDEDLKVLQAQSEEFTVYSNHPLPLHATIKIRDQLSTIEYREVYEANQKAMSKDDWLNYCGITSTQHLNYSSGRSVVKGGLCRKLHDLLLAHSYIMEASAFVLAPLVISSKTVSDFSWEDYGLYAIKLLGALKSCRNLGLEFYWSQRSHIDVMQTYIYNSTYSTRKGTSERLEESLGNWMYTPEFSAFRASKDSGDKKSRKSSATDKAQEMQIFKLLKVSRDERLSAEQKEATGLLMKEALGSVSRFAEMSTPGELIRWLEKILPKDGNDQIAFTEASSSQVCIDDHQRVDGSIELTNRELEEMDVVPSNGLLTPDEDDIFRL